MDLCDDVDTNLARTIPRICATNKFDAQIHGNVRRCGAGYRRVSIAFGIRGEMVQTKASQK